MEGDPTRLPESILGRHLHIQDMDMHFLEAGDQTMPLLVLLHGFPELSFSWRKIMVPLAQAGYHVVAPDQRGYGRTRIRALREPIAYDADLRPFRMINLVTDIVALVFALGHNSVKGIIGHDFGSLVAAYCALIRPDIFHSVTLMSAPFTGAPSLPYNISDEISRNRATFLDIDAELSDMNPPRKHYTSYFCSPSANSEMVKSTKGMHAFLRAYFHVKSADWSGNNPHPLGSADASVVATLPEYYVMPLFASMPEAVASYAPSAEEVDCNTWLPDSDLAVYTDTFGRTGFQGGLNWYRCMKHRVWTDELTLFAGRKIEVPALFLAGSRDWGVYQNPGAVDMMRQVCPKMIDDHFVLVPGAGHWVQQEQPQKVVECLVRFLHKVANNENV